MEHTVILGLAAVGITTLLCQWVAWWLRLPAILFLMLAGLIAGPLTHWFNPADTFGELFHPMITVAVAIILFEGGLTLKFHEIQGVERVVRNLLTVGVLVTAILSSIAVHLLLHFPITYSILFGAIMTVSGPTVIFPLLQTVRTTRKITSILHWEGVMVDPIGAILAVVIFSTILSLNSASGIAHILLFFAVKVLLGLVSGVVAGKLWSLVIKRGWIPSFLYNVGTLIVVYELYAITQLAGESAGLLAVTLMGITLANERGLNIRSIVSFKESISVLLISGLFLMLSANVKLGELVHIGSGALILALLQQFVIRPLVVGISCYGSPLNWRERIMIAWIGPKGIVSAAIAAIFAIELPNTPDWNSEHLSLAVFVVIFTTVVIQSTTSRWLAKILCLRRN